MSPTGDMAPWLIGGPGRCGKTHLALALWNHRSTVVGFPLEGLFSIYSRRWVPFTRQSILSLLEEYLTRPRYIDAGREASEQPLDYLTSPLNTLRAMFPEYHNHPVVMIGWILDQFAKENDGKAWAAFDLHPEFRYPFFRKHLPNLKLAVMTRDPREAICAALFWRGEPCDSEARAARFKHSLIMYCLAIQTANTLSRRWPNEVQIFDFNRLISGDVRERRRIAQNFDMSMYDVNKSYDLVPDFDFDPNRGFLSPGGDRVNFLSDRELIEISSLTGIETLHRTDGTPPRRRFLKFARLVFASGRLSPVLARTITDFAYYPRRSIAQRINRLRELASDLKSGMLGTFKVSRNAG